MAMEIERYCPRCEEERTFWLTASTLMHLGEKTKWGCAECSYGFIRLGEIESDADALA